jgi:hypothetical protein
MKANTTKRQNTENQKDEHHEPHQNNEGKPRGSRKESSSFFLQDTLGSRGRAWSYGSWIYNYMQVCGFLLGHQFPSPIKLTFTI